MDCQGGKLHTGSKVKLLDGVQGISALGTKCSEDARQGEKGGGGWERAGPQLPWMMQGGKSLGLSGKRLGCLGVSMPTAGWEFPCSRTASSSSSSVFSALLS